MTKVTSKKSISFPKLGWGISAGEVKDLPEDKEAQERILQEADITQYEGEVAPKINIKSEKDK